MKYINHIAMLFCVSLSVASFSAASANAFRLANGKLLSTGMTQLELVAQAGTPLSVEDETVRELGETRVVKQRLTFELEGDIGGRYWVQATLQQGNVVALEVIQQNR